MAFLLTIVAGAVLAVIGRKKGFMAMWILLFNVLISIYVSIMVSPTIIGFVKFLDTNGYYRALCILFVALLVFLCSNHLVSMFLARAFSVPLPKFFEGFSSAVLGFFAGHFACAFILFIIGITPISNISLVRKFSGDASLAQAVKEPVIWSCDMVSTFSFQADRRAREQTIRWFATGKTAPSEDGDTLEPSVQCDP